MFDFGFQETPEQIRARLKRRRELTKAWEEHYAPMMLGKKLSYLIYTKVKRGKFPAKKQ